MVTGSFGYLTSLYKVVDSKSGNCYALRRVERVRTNHEMVVCSPSHQSRFEIFMQ